MKNLKYLLIIFLLSHFYLGAISQELKPDYFEPDKDNKKIKRSKDPYYKGLLLYANGDLNEAITEFTKCIDNTKPTNSNHYDFYYWRGSVYLDNGDLDNAFDDLTFASSNETNRYTSQGLAHHCLAKCLQKLNKIDKAIIEAKKGIEVNIKNIYKLHDCNRPMMYMTLVNLYYSSENYNKAMDPIEKAIKYGEQCDDFDLDVYYFVGGGICFDNRKYEKSKYYLYKDSKLSNNPSLLFYRGRVNYILNDGKSANSDFNKVIEFDDPPSSKVAFSYFFIGDKQKAFSLMIDRVDNSLKTERYKGECYDLACLYSLNNDIDNSIKYLTIAVENGYDNFTWIKNDSDMDNIRNTQEFRDFLNKYDKE